MSAASLALTTELIRRDFQLPEAAEGQLTEAELLRLLCDQVDYYLQHRMEWLLSTLYRLDVREDLVHAALHPSAPEPANLGLARLILERQKMRAYTKLNIRSEPLDEDMQW